MPKPESRAVPRPPRSHLPWGIAAVCAAGFLGAPAPRAEWGDAHAAPNTGGIANPADDRARMQAELERINRTLEAIRASLERGAIKVDVVRMPAERAAQ